MRNQTAPLTASADLDLDALTAQLQGRAAVNTISQLAPSALRIVLGLGLAVLLARYLSVTGLGRYSLMIAFVGLFNGIFNDWGLIPIVIRDLSNGAQRRSELLSSAAALQAVVSLGSYLLLLIGVFALGFGADLSWAVTVFGASLLIGPLTILSLPVIAELRMARFVVPSLVVTVLNCCLVGAALVLHLDLTWLAVATLIPLVLQAVWIGRLGLLSVGRLARASLAGWPRLVRESWPIGAGTTLKVAWQQAPLLLLGLISVHEAGIYAAASRLVLPVVLIPIAISVSAFPILSGKWARDRADFRDLLERLTSTSLVVVVPAGLCAVALTPAVVSVLYGSAYVASSASLQAMIASSALLFPLILLTEAMNAAAMQRLNLTILLVSTPTALVLMFIAALAFGAIGAAIALCAGYALYTLLVVVAASRAELIRTRPLSIFAAPLASTGVGVAVLFLLTRAGPTVQALGAVVAALAASYMLSPAITRRSLAATVTLGGFLRR